MKKEKKYSLIIVSLLIILVVLIILTICLGKYKVTPLESLSILFGINSNPNEMTANVVLRLRLPRIIGAILVGAALSLSGSAYQGIYRNPLISPDFLGVSSGACIGAAVAILLSLSSYYISIFAFIGGIIAVLITSSIPKLIKNRSNIMLILSGSAINFKSPNIDDIKELTIIPESISIIVERFFINLGIEDVISTAIIPPIKANMEI